jgi:anti-sigma factor RsiW
MFWGNRNSDRVPAPIETLTEHVDAWEELAIDYLDGRLDTRTKTAIDQHLAGCPACACRLRLQQTAIDYIQAFPLKDAPPALEDAVLSEALFPSRPTRPVRVTGLERPTKWSDTWQRRRNSWIPASAIVAAVLVAVVGFAILRSGAGSMDETARTTVAAADAAGESTNADAPMLGTGAANEDAQYGTEGTTSPGATSTTTAAATTLAGGSVEMAVAKTAIPPILDRTGMIDGMTAVTDFPAFFVFESVPAPTEDGQPEEGTGGGTPDTAPTTIPSPITGAEDTFVTAEQAEEIAAQITSFTDLQPLDEGLAFSRPTFAAYVAKDQAPQFIDLLRSIAASEGLVVELDMEPAQPVMEWSSLLLQQKAELVALSAQRTPAPAISSWSFTTSTLQPPVSDTSSPPETPDDAGTYVLVVILVNSLP